MNWVGFHRASQERLTHFGAVSVMGQQLQYDGKKTVTAQGSRMLTTYLKPSPHCSSIGVDLPDASKEVSPGLPETLKVIEIGKIMLDT